MSSDFETYEQDFGTITAELTNKIGRIPKLSGEEKTQLVLNVDKQLEEVRELLEQMDLEVREIPVQSRAMYNSRLKSYKQEMEKLEKDFISRLFPSSHRPTPPNPPPTGLPRVSPPLTCSLILAFTRGLKSFYQRCASLRPHFCSFPDRARVDLSSTAISSRKTT
uniref:Vesicle transport through interaction with t-SNAREs 1A n=1 Tax=Cynoglossus semilaevis TaxID=244447 RepID=A0A3P8VDA0_CYNSE